MTRTAQLFRNGRRHAVRLRSEFRFEGNEIFIRQDPENAETKVVLRHSGLACRPERYTNYQQGWMLIRG